MRFLPDTWGWAGKWIGILGLACLPFLAQAQGACQAKPPPAPSGRALELARLALQENEAMGAALIDAGGGLIRQGHAEAERQVWRRVWNYWRAVPQWYEKRMAWMALFSSEAAQRVSLVDQPWSAAFISWLMREAGWDEAAFVFSAAHHDYVRAAVQAGLQEQQGTGSTYAYRACDVRQTAPRVGDLLCFTRASDAHLQDFERVAQAVLKESLRMHCDVVVRRNASMIETVGGNVLQSVTRRKLSLANDGSGRIWPAYFPDLAGADAGLMPHTFLNQQSWSVLLQLRSETHAP